ncbi:hypothetical protein DdX_10049 [Ditylenchus destructor]|uniref:Cystatin domain-containing protein n=1 Tax=Ditylenchus destructor TaxID=166010 RepID=A0AAD4N3D3_9BILA|nr:hypothetical protein DdX_10049 [Ditylenchus destructor]
MIRLNTILAIVVVIFAQVWAGDDGRDGSDVIVGGFEHVDSDDTHVKILTDLAVEDYNARSNSLFYQPLRVILDAKKGRGMPKDTYAIILSLGKSSCRKTAIEVLITEDLDGVVRDQIYYKDIPMEELTKPLKLHE